MLNIWVHYSDVKGPYCKRYLSMEIRLYPGKFRLVREMDQYINQQGSQNTKNWRWKLILVAMSERKGGKSSSTPSIFMFYSILGFVLLVFFFLLLFYNIPVIFWETLDSRSIEILQYAKRCKNTREDEICLTVTRLPVTVEFLKLQPRIAYRNCSDYLKPGVFATIS